MSAGFGFHFGPHNTFSASAASENGSNGIVLSASSAYQSFDNLAAGTYHLNPIAVSGSDADVAKVLFVYKGGLDGMGRL